MSEVYDDEVSQLLNSWGLSDLRTKFKANYVIKQALEYLTESDIVELIPKIGQRAIFRGRLQEWRQQNRIPVPSRVEPETEKKTAQKHDSDPKTSEEPTVVFKPKPNIPPKPAIQSKVQQFYISTLPKTAANPTRLVTSTPKPAQVPKADLTPFVTSIIRVETNCEKTSSPKNGVHVSPATAINRTRILQKLNQMQTIREASPVEEPIRVAKEEKIVEDKHEDPSTDADLTDASHLYPIVKLETEQSWNGYPQIPQEHFMDMIAQQKMEISGAKQQDPAEGIKGEADNNMSQLKRMPKPVVRLRRKRLKKNVQTIDVRNILMNSDPGRLVLDYYETNEYLGAAQRRLLIETVVQHCWVSEMRLSPGDCLLIAREIIELFPNEKLEYYFTLQPGKSPKSPIYNKYRNMRRRHRLQKRSRRTTMKKIKLKPVTLSRNTDETIIIS